MKAETFATWLAIAAAIGGAIFNYAVLGERSEKTRITVERHEERLDAIERDQTTNDKLTKLKESVDAMGWQVGFLSETVKDLKEKRRK